MIPISAWAQSMKDPLSYSLKTYGFMLAVSILGGLVGWYAKLKRGDVVAWNVSQLIGEISTSAFAGLLTFWLCEWMNIPQILTAALVGVSGHLGTKAIAIFEDFAQRKWGAVTDQNFPKIEDR